VKGNGVNLLLTTTDLYQQFKAQILASGGMIVQNGLPITWPRWACEGGAAEGQRPTSPMTRACRRTTSRPSTPRVWKFMLHPQFNFHVGKFIDNTETGLGKEAYDYAYISTRFMFTCDNPFLNVPVHGDRHVSTAGACAPRGAHQFRGARTFQEHCMALVASLAASSR
jgi:hypothetical protein